MLKKLVFCLALFCPVLMVAASSGCGSGDAEIIESDPTAEQEAEAAAESAEMDKEQSGEDE